MTITGQGFPVFLLAAVAAGTGLQELTDRFSQTKGEDALRQALHQVAELPAAPETGCAETAVAMWTTKENESTSTLRPSLWLRGIGPEYIEMAFGWAHEADPNAKLFDNNFGGEGKGSKADAVYAGLSKLTAAGIPVHGAGLQMHLQAENAPSANEIESNMRRLAALGFDIHVTEMDVRVELPAGEQTLATQAEIYRDVVAACVSVSSCRSITFWGFTDRHCWVTAAFSGYGSPLLFDEAYAAKPAYYGVREALGTASQQAAHLPNDSKRKAGV